MSTVADRRRPHASLNIAGLVRGRPRPDPVPENGRAAAKVEIEQPQAFAARTELVAEGAPLCATWALLSGWACHARMLEDGRRQILQLLLPGDLFGAAIERASVSPSAVIALTAVTAAEWNGDAARSGQADRPASVFRKVDALSSACLFNQIVRLGRQNSYERLAHLLLELRDRLAAAGLSTGNRFELPLTQEMLADVLGLTSVHVNRTLQHLRRDGLVEIKGGAVTLLDPEALARLSEYKSPLNAAA